MLVAKRQIGIRPNSAQAGFTVLELMVATSIFAIVLLVLTVGVMSFSRDYFSSINRSSTQTVARSIIDDIAHTIQFSGSTLTENVVGNTHAWCFDNVQYLAATGYQVTPTSDLANFKNTYGLIKRVASGCGNVDVTNNGSYTFDQNTDKELLAKNMRISLLQISKVGNAYTIHVRVATGDTELFNNIGPPDWSQMACKSQSGSQFCAVSDLSTTVEQRIK